MPTYLNTIALFWLLKGSLLVIVLLVVFSFVKKKKNLRNPKLSRPSNKIYETMAILIAKTKSLPNSN